MEKSWRDWRPTRPDRRISDGAVKEGENAQVIGFARVMRKKQNRCGMADSGGSRRLEPVAIDPARSTFPSRCVCRGRGERDRRETWQSGRPAALWKRRWMHALGIDIQMPTGVCDAQSKTSASVSSSLHDFIVMKHVMPARTQLKVRTVFNILGPLSIQPPHAFKWWGIVAGNHGIDKCTSRAWPEACVCGPWRKRHG
jgi:hypothetical protein